MAITIISPTSLPIPQRVTPAIVQIRRDWTDPWRTVPELELLGASVHAGGDGLDECTLQHRYGTLKQPWETALATHGSANLTDCWIRIQMAGNQGLQTSWIGRVSGEARDSHGTSGVPSGVQKWTCLGPQQILRKIPVSRAIWWDSDRGVEQEVGWVAGLNNREGGAQPGTRSAAKHGWGGVYLYGSDAEWTHRQYIDYLLARFADDLPQGPTWTLGGQCNLLDDTTEPIDWDTTQTLADMLGRLIPKNRGIDYRVAATANGFEVVVFALAARDWQFGNATLPRNPDHVYCYTSRTADNIQTTVVRTADHRVRRINILGRRIVVCCTLENDDDAGIANLKGLWDTFLEGAYDGGTGNHADPAEAHDLARKQDKYRAVYQNFGAPRDWDHNTGDNGGAAPQLDPAGKLQPAAGVYPSADYQNQIRSTLDWVPLREGWDYSQDPAVERAWPGGTAERSPPMVWCVRTNPFYGVVPGVPDLAYLPIEAEDMDVSVLPGELGVRIDCSPNHLLAEGHFGFAEETLVEPQDNWEELIVTLAFESDQRFKLTKDFPGGGDPLAADGAIDIEVPDAECWYLAPHTMVGVDGDFQPLRSGAAPRILRADSDRLELAMAGAISRYFTERGRAEIVIKGYVPAGDLLGRILMGINSGGGGQWVEAPITSVTWQGGKGPTTTISAGFA